MYLSVSLSLVHRRAVRRLHQTDRVQGIGLADIAFALHDDLIVGGFQVPIPLIVSCALPNFEVHNFSSFLC